MNKYTTQKCIPFSLLVSLLLLAFICSACGNTRINSVKAPTAIATRPVSAFANGPVVYVALGASDAVGVGANQPGSQGYVPLVAAHLPAGSHLVNLGVSGIHLHEALTHELPLALSTAPRLVTIWLVANDFVAGVGYDSYMHDLNDLLQKLHDGTTARIAMANLPNLTLLPAFSRSTPEQKTQMNSEIQRWNARIAALAEQYNVVLVDLLGKNSQLTAHPEYVSLDGFHPSPAGYVQLANLFWEAINAKK